MLRNSFRITLSLCLITWLFTIGTAVADMIVNDAFVPPGPTLSGQLYNPTSATDAPNGIFSFTATFCNENGPDMPDGLETRTITLTNGNVLLNRNMTTSTGDGVGSRFHFPPTGDYSNLNLLQHECAAMEYQIGLHSSDRFHFETEVWVDRTLVMSAAGPKHVQEGALVHLHVDWGLLDPGEIPDFSWVQEIVGSEPTVQLTDANTNNPSFNAPALKKNPKVPQTLRFKVTGILNGNTDFKYVDVEVNAGKVIVDAGPKLSPTAGNRVTLHATSIPHSPVKWTWVQTQGPKVVLTGIDTGSPSFMALAASKILEFEAIAKVGKNYGADKVMVISVRQTKLLVKSGGDIRATSGHLVLLNCTASGGVPNTVGWHQLSGTSVTLIDPDTLHASFKAPDVSVKTELRFECSADNSHSRMLVEVGPPTPALTADAGQNQDVLEGATLHPHGNGSGGTPPLSYAWVETTSTGVTITNADTQQPSFVAPAVDTDTPVTLKVTVTDLSSPLPVTKSASITYTVKNRTVRVSAGDDARTAPGHSLHLHAQPQGGLPPYTYAWSQTAGTTVNLSDPSSDNPDFTVPSSITVDETLTFRVDVTDSLLNPGDDSVDVVVKAPASPLTVAFTSPVSVANGGEVSLHSTVVGGTTPYSYVYAWSSVPSVTFSPNSASANVTYTQPNAAVALSLLVSNTGDTPVTQSGTVTVAQPTVVAPRIMAEVCNGPPIICEQRFREELCEARTDVNSKINPTNYLRNSADGSRTLQRTCENVEACQNDWWVTSSDDDKCTTFNPDALMTYAFECTWCCTRDRCNLPIRPTDSSLYIGISSTDPSGPSLPLIPLEEGTADSSTPQDDGPGAD